MELLKASFLRFFPPFVRWKSESTGRWADFSGRGFEGWGVFDQIACFHRTSALISASFAGIIKASFHQFFFFRVCSHCREYGGKASQRKSHNLNLPVGLALGSLSDHITSGSISITLWPFNCRKGHLPAPTLSLLFLSFLEREQAGIDISRLSTGSDCSWP
jgi:hypothetical protein